VPEPAIDTPAAPSTDIVVSVNKDRSIAINAEPVALERLRDRLLAIFAGRARKVIFVRGHRNLDFQDVAAIIDIAKEANVFQVALMTE
jgi:biopolymer transport protein ExbD